MDEAITSGHYARNQLLCSARLIAWSHTRRFRTGVALARGARGRRMLDYGCGDATFLAMLMGSRSRPMSAVGAEIDPNVVSDCRARFAQVHGLSFVHTDELKRPEHAGRYDLVTCMEVLEHVVDLDPLVDSLVRLLAPSGTLIVSVPVETGLPVLVKQTLRRIAGWRRLGDYAWTSAYTFRELWAAVTAGSEQHFPRTPFEVERDGKGFYDHKGFNWRALRRRLAQRLRIERTVASPVPWLPPDLASQAWFICRLPASAPREPSSRADKRALDQVVARGGEGERTQDPDRG